MSEMKRMMVGIAAMQKRVYALHDSRESPREQSSETRKARSELGCRVIWVLRTGDPATVRLRDLPSSLNKPSRPPCAVGSVVSFTTPISRMLIMPKGPLTKSAPALSNYFLSIVMFISEKAYSCN